MPKKMVIYKDHTSANYSFEFSNPMPNYLGTNFNLDEEFEKNGDDYPSRCVLDIFTTHEESDNQVVNIEISLGDLIAFEFSVRNGNITEVQHRDVMKFDIGFVTDFLNFINQIFKEKLEISQLMFMVKKS
jgi:hypothetical protein